MSAPSVLVVNPFFPPYVPGGGEHSLVEFCRAMSGAGWRIRVITMAWDGNPRAETIDGYVVEWVSGPVHSPDPHDPSLDAFSRSGAGQDLMVAHVAELVAEGHRFDWLLANNAQYISAAAEIQARFNIPAAAVLRDTQLICETAACIDGCTAAKARACRGLIGQLLCCLRFRRRREPFTLSALPNIVLGGVDVWRRRERLRRDARRLSRIVVISDALSRLTRQVPGLRKDTIDVIPNFVTREPDVPQSEVDAYLAHNRLEPGKYMLLAGRKSIGKGIDTAVDVARRLHDRGSPIRILAVGQGQAPAEAENFCDRPPVGRSLLMGLLSHSLGALIPGRRQEGLHRTMLDALGLGVPIVCTESGGVPEGVVHGGNGFIVRCNDPDALCDAIVRVAQWGEGERQRCRELAAKLHAEKFSHDVIQRRWQEFDKYMRRS